MNDSLYLSKYMMACPFKENFGVECPGCGMQRSAVALGQGNLVDSFYLYPALIPMLFMFLLLGVHLKWKLKRGAQMLLVLYIVNMTIVVINYVLKLI